MRKYRIETRLLCVLQQVNPTYFGSEDDIKARVMMFERWVSEKKMFHNFMLIFFIYTLTVFWGWAIRCLNKKISAQRYSVPFQSKMKSVGIYNYIVTIQTWLKELFSRLIEKNDFFLCFYTLVSPILSNFSSLRVFSPLRVFSCSQETQNIGCKRDFIASWRDSLTWWLQLRRNTITWVTPKVLKDSISS